MEGDEIVLQYFMPLAPGIPARKFFLNLNIFSQGEEVTMKQAFNQTIEFIEESKIVDFELLGLYAIFYGILFAICYALYNYAVAQGWIKKSKPAKKTRTLNYKYIYTIVDCFSNPHTLLCSLMQKSKLIERNGSRGPLLIRKSEKSYIIVLPVVYIYYYYSHCNMKIVKF